MMRSRSVIIILIVGLIAAGGTGYYMYNKPHRNIQKSKVAYSLTANELYAAYDADEAGSDEKYLDEVIEVSGIINSVSRNQNNKAVVTLNAEGAMADGISCTLNEQSSDQLDQLSKGDEIKLKCRCTGKLLDVVLIDCGIITKTAANE